MGSGAFLVGACGLLSDAYIAALLRQGGYHAQDFGPNEQAAIRRTIAERCLYGVDLNPMAVQLARLSVWLATLAADRPLTFLDHHRVVGNSILGVWLSCLRRPPGRSRTRASVRLPLFSDELLQDTIADALPTRFALELDPNDSVDQIKAKERALAALWNRESTLSKWKQIADLWCAHWFASTALSPSAVFNTLADGILLGPSALAPAMREQFLRESKRAADVERFFHWELEFPEVFFGPGGRRRPAAGFDAVIGNPPWEMVRADHAGSGHGRPRDRNRSVVRFSRDAGIYLRQSSGHANEYQLFAERALMLTRAGG